MDNIYCQLLARNARETYPFVAVHAANGTLLNQVDALQNRCESLEREISKLHLELDDAVGTAANNGGKGSSAAATAALKNEARLRDRLEKLQEELNAKLKAHAEDQASALKTAKELSELKDQNLVQESTITNLKKENDRKERAIEHLTEQLTDAQGRTKLAEQQYVGLKESIRTLQHENDQLQKEKLVLEGRLMEDKTKMSDEMNVLTEMVDKLKREVDMLRSLNHQEQQRISGWFGRHSSADRTNSIDNSPKTEKGASPRLWGGTGVVVPSGPKQIIQAHAAEATSVRYDSLGADLLVTGSSDSFVKVWDVGTGTIRATLRGTSGHTITAVDMAGSLVVGAGTDKTCRVWNIRTERMIHHLVGHQHKVTCVRLFENGHTVITGSADRSLKLWDISQKTYRQTVTLRHGSTSHCVDISSDSTAVTGHFDGSLRFWDIRTGDRTMDICGMHESGISSVQFNPQNGMQVLTNGLDSCLKLIDVRTGSAIHTFRHPEFHTSQGWSSCAFSPNGAYGAAGSSSTGHVFVWDTNDASLKAKLEGHKASAVGVAWSRGGSSGQQVASVDRKGGLVLWA